MGFAGSYGLSRMLLCVPVPSGAERKMGADTMVATRCQVPLMPAWALSIHKAHGQSPEYLRRASPYPTPCSPAVGPSRVGISASGER